MDAYAIKPGEIILLKEDQVFDHRRSDSNLSTGELMLTTNSLVFTRKGMFNKIKSVEVFPVNDIQVYNGKPQAKLTSKLGMKNLEIYLANGEILRFGMGDGFSKGSIIKWVNAIFELLTGHEYTEYDKSAYAIPGIQTVANYVGGTIDAFKKSLGLGVNEPEVVVKYCQNCGAQIKGRSGDIGKCDYCGSSQKL